jgi:hypothetical protein
MMSGSNDKQGSVRWSGELDPNAWHADSTIPASEQLSDIQVATEVPTELPEPSDELEDDDDDDEVVEPAGEGDDAFVSTGASRKRSKTIARKQMLRERRRMVAQGTLPEILDYERPVHRSECREGVRPCLYVSCRYHLYLDVNPVTGSIKINFPDKEPWELEDTCALDVAERGGITLEEVGEIMNLTRERIRQVEVSGLDKLRDGEADLHTFLDGRELDGLPISRLPIVRDE